jgi:hypothetical protein
MSEFVGLTKLREIDLRYFGHMKRMDEHRIPKRILDMKMSGKRPRGRPCTWWLDQVKRDIEEEDAGGR